MITANEAAKELRTEKDDLEKAKALCREIRDSETASLTEKLEAIKLLHVLTSKNSIKRT